MRKEYSDKLRNRQRFLTVLKIVLPLLYALLLLFIFGNSLQTGEESAETSSRVVDAVQAVVAWVAPQSPIATATGEAYAKLHADIRTLAHFTEFALLGCSMLLCVESWTGREKRNRIYAWAGGTAWAGLDEIHQLAVDRRSGQIADVALDSFGVAFGVMITALILKKVWDRKAA